MGLYQGNKAVIYGDILKIIRLFGLCGPILVREAIIFCDPAIVAVFG